MVSKPAPAVLRTPELVNFLRTFGPAHKFNKWITDMELVLKGNMFAGFYVQKARFQTIIEDGME